MQSNKRALWSLLIGLMLAVVAVIGVNGMLGERPEVQSPFKVVSLVVAAHDLGFGAELNKAVLAVKDWPENSVPQGSFTKLEDVLGDGKEPRVALKPIVKGEPVLMSKITGFGAKATMSTVLPEGKRAFSVRVNDISGVAGFLLPGDRVDVLLTRQIEEKNSDKLDQVTDVILQNIVVRGIDQIADEDRNKPQVVKSVTLEVSPEEAQKLALAEQVGQLSLALRNVAANDTAATHSVRVRDLVHESAPAPAPPPKQVAEKPKRLEPVLPSVIVRHGVKSESVTFTR
jgi:pilus assembly protein CpaB